MPQYPLALDDSDSLDRYLVSLRLRLRRLMADQQSSLDRTPLNERERKAYDSMYRKTTSQLGQRTEDERLQGEALLKQAIDAMGERELLYTWISPPLVMGVPYMWFVINALICLAAFICTSNFIVLFFLAPVIHGIGYVYSLPRLKRQREEGVEKILGGY